MDENTTTTAMAGSPPEPQSDLDLLLDSTTLELLGQGSQGSVYGEPGCDEVFKVSALLTPELQLRQACVEGCIRALRHPQLVAPKLVMQGPAPRAVHQLWPRVFPAGKEPEVMVQVMERLEGGTLHSKAVELKRMEQRDGATSLTARLRASNWVLRELTPALERLHAAGYVHRDVKPANVMLRCAMPSIHQTFVLGMGAGGDGDGASALCLVDFGLAFRTGRRQPNLLGGTKPYMSAGALQGEKPRPVDDWYALGMMIYELLFPGSHPYLSSEELELPYAEAGQLMQDRDLPGKWPLYALMYGSDILSLVERLLCHDNSRRAGAKEVYEYLGLLSCGDGSMSSSGSSGGGSASSTSSFASCFSFGSRRKKCSM